VDSGGSRVGLGRRLLGSSMSLDQAWPGRGGTRRLV